MILRPATLRPIPFQEPVNVCLQCLSRLSRPKSAWRRPLSTTAAARDAVVSPRQARNAFNKDYFWANGALAEVLGQSRRGLRSNTTAPREGQSTAASVGATAASIHPEAPRHANSSLNALESAQEELPHRRRKRLRQEAAEASQTAFPIAPDASSRLTTASANLPTNSFRRRFTTYLSLSKPRLSFLVLLTTAGAYSLYPVPALLGPAATDAPSLSTLTLLFLATGTALASASANAFNMLLEPAHDAKMSRTRNRPLVRKLITPRGALLFALGTGITGVAALYYGVNPTTAFLGALNIGLYAFVYTPLKRIHVINTWVGAVVGGIPPLMGWTAAAGQVASHGGNWRELLFGEGSAGGWLLAALLFAWQFPHFNALSWTIRDEYKHAGYRMLAWVNTNMNGRVALRYSILMFPVCFGLAYVGVTDWGFVVTSSAVNTWMTYEAVRFWKHGGQKGTARALFWASVWHLPIVLVLAMAHKKGLWERIWRGITGASGVEDDWDEEEYEDEDEEEKKHMPAGKKLVAA